MQLDIIKKTSLSIIKRTNFIVGLAQENEKMLPGTIILKL